MEQPQNESRQLKWEGKFALTALTALGVWVFGVLPLIYFPWKSGPTYFMGFDSTGWTALGAIAGWFYCLLTMGLLMFAIIQVSATRREAKITRTLAACERYDIDPIMDRVTRRISRAYNDGSLRSDPSTYAIDLNSLFNYFEGIAIGVARGHYDAEIVREQLESIMVGHIGSMTDAAWSNPSAGGRYEIEDFNNMMDLYRTWTGCSTPATPGPVGGG